MTEYQIQLLKTAIKVGALKFGEFTLKSGRKSPYFFNAGAFSDGSALANLAQSYADVIAKWIKDGKKIDILFGPAYKGIPLVAAISVCLSMQYKINLPWTFNRKEAKDHGEGGTLVGSPLTGNVVIVDDVITAGTAIRESMEIIKQHDATLSGVLLSLDRQEKGRGSLSAIQELERDYQCQVYSIITLDDLISYLTESETLSAHLPAVKAYRERYGIN